MDEELTHSSIWDALEKPLELRCVYSVTSWSCWSEAIKRRLEDHHDNKWHISTWAVKKGDAKSDFVLRLLWVAFEQRSFRTMVKNIIDTKSKRL